MVQSNIQNDNRGKIKTYSAKARLTFEGSGMPVAVE